jgi:peptide/nickel transport system permease protein
MSRVAAYYASRVLMYAFVGLAAFTIVFFFLRLMPGDPVTAYLDSLRSMGINRRGGTEVADAYAARFGLEGDLLTQYLSALRRTFLEGDLGVSLMGYPDNVESLIALRLPWSIWLLGVSTLMAWVIGLVAGTMLGWFRGTVAERLVYNLAICFAQVPQYLLALFLVLTLAFGLSWFPTGGAYSAAVRRGFTTDFVGSVVYHSILPILSIVAVAGFFWLLTTRALTISVLGEDYVLFAEAKGLRRIRVLRRYVLRNTILPQVTAFAISLAFIVNGFYLIEWVFRYPGVGTLLVTAVGQRDFNVVQGIILLSIFIVLGANFVVELLNPLIDPRIRSGHGER